MLCHCVILKTNINWMKMSTNIYNSSYASTSHYMPILDIYVNIYFNVIFLTFEAFLFCSLYYTEHFPNLFFILDISFMWSWRNLEKSWPTFNRAILFRVSIIEFRLYWTNSPLFLGRKTQFLMFEKSFKLILREKQRDLVQPIHIFTKLHSL